MTYPDRHRRPASSHNGTSSLPLIAEWRFGSVAPFQPNRLPQSGHGFVERVVLESARGHQSGECLGDDVELLLRGLGAAAPSVLEQSDQQEREDACDGVDSHLPGFRIAPQRQADEPGQNDRHAGEEKWRAADPLVYGFNEVVEGRAPGAGACGGTFVLLAHAASLCRRSTLAWSYGHLDRRPE